MLGLYVNDVESYTYDHANCRYWWFAATTFLLTLLLDSSTSVWNELKKLRRRHAAVYICRTGCRKVSSCSIPSATTSGLPTRPSFSFSTKRICSKRKSRNLRSQSASANIRVSDMDRIIVLSHWPHVADKVRQHVAEHVSSVKALLEG